MCLHALISVLSLCVWGRGGVKRGTHDFRFHGMLWVVVARGWGGVCRRRAVMGGGVYFEGGRGGTEVNSSFLTTGGKGGCGEEGKEGTQAHATAACCRSGLNGLRRGGWGGVGWWVCVCGGGGGGPAHGPA